MKIKFPLGEAVIAVILFTAFCTKFYFDGLEIGSKRQSPHVTRATADFQAQSLRRFNFGFQNVLADSLWVQLLQMASHKPLAQDEVSWEYAQLNAITALDPKFNRAYSFGAAFLSVFRRDKMGAQLILEKWARWEPTNWRAHYVLGFHYFFEQKKFDEASRSILRAASLPHAPAWLNALGIRLLSQTGAHFAALHIAVDLYPSMTTWEGKDRLQKRIRSLRFNLIKTAWENALHKFPEQNKRRPASTSEIIPLVKRELAELSQGLSQLHIHEDLAEIFQEKFNFFYNPAHHRVEFSKDFDASEMAEIEESGLTRSKQGEL